MCLTQLCPINLILVRGALSFLLYTAPLLQAFLARNQQLDLKKVSCTFFTSVRAR
jgi:hypothetical protein